MQPGGGSHAPPPGQTATSSEIGSLRNLCFVGYCLLYFLGRTASLKAFATRIFTTVFAGILIGSPVAGFRPIRALRFARTVLPTPGITKAPTFFVSDVAKQAISSMMPAASFFESVSQVAHNLTFSHGFLSCHLLTSLFKWISRMKHEAFKV
jgi:hypothetical protein